MDFNSGSFLVFFPFVTAVYFLIPHSFRWGWLLAASCFFYACFIPVYILILFLLIGIDYGMGILIEEERVREGRPGKYLIISIIATSAVLFFFKYFNFFNANVVALSNFLGLHYAPKVLGIILPLGLSFHTFQSLSYVIEVYRGRQKAERHLGIYALYVMFYPQLVAGPIERPYHLIPQLREQHFIEYRRITEGLKLMAWGMFKKVVIADQLAVFVNQIWGNIFVYQGPELLLASVFFAFEIYCDFSGYSDIAVGTAGVMGFRLTSNFNRPFFSRSLSDLWTRWHISLFSWLKDYIYRPLCWNRVFPLDPRVSLLIVFLVSGFWHGASWTYVMWGGVNGLLIVLGIEIQKRGRFLYRKASFFRESRLCQGGQILGTFGIFCLTGIFFRSSSVAEGLVFLRRLPQGWDGSFPGMGQTVAAVCHRTGIPAPYFATSVLLLGVLLCAERLQFHSPSGALLADYPVWIRWSYYFMLVIAMIFLGEYGQNQFFYYKF